MSFLYISDSQKRDEIVADFLSQKKGIPIQEDLILPEEDIEEEKNEQDIVEEIKIPNHCKIVKHFGGNFDLPATADGKDQMGNVLKTHIGNGIQFLPGDINGLQIKLDYLLAEYHAGNTSATHNQIVAITDELLRRKQISQTKYNNINNFIQK